MSRFLRLALAAALILPVAPAMAAFSESYEFLKAIRDGDAAKVNEIMGKPGSVIMDTKDQATGETALHILTKDRNLDWMRVLIGKGAKLDAGDKKGETPLIAATRIGYVEGASLLLNYKAQVDKPNAGGETPLIIAVQNRDTVMVRTLMAAGANPNKADRMAGLSARDYAKRDIRAGAILKLLDAPKPAAVPVPAPAVSAPKL